MILMQQIAAAALRGGGCDCALRRERPQQLRGEEMGKKKAKRLPKPILEKQSRKKKVAKIHKPDKPVKIHKK